MAVFPYSISTRSSPFHIFVSNSMKLVKLKRIPLPNYIVYSSVKIFQRSEYLNEHTTAATREPADEPAIILGNKSYSYKAFIVPK